MIYGKLVRNNIPEIIAETGKDADIRLAKQEELLPYLIKKLDEEVAEYKATNDPKELVDIHEVIMAIADYHYGSENPDKFWNEYRRKRNKCGSFSHGVILLEVSDE